MDALALCVINLSMSRKQQTNTAKPCYGCRVQGRIGASTSSRPRFGCMTNPRTTTATEPHGIPTTSPLGGGGRFGQKGREVTIGVAEDSSNAGAGLASIGNSSNNISSSQLLRSMRERKQGALGSLALDRLQRDTTTTGEEGNAKVVCTESMIHLHFLCGAVE